MFVTLLFKEFAQSVISLRYVLSYLLLALLILTAAVIQGNIAAEEREQYFHNQAARSDILTRYAHYNRIWLMIAPVRPPAPLAVLIGDHASAEGNLFFANPETTLYGRFDLTDVLIYVLGIMAIIFSFDGISGEKETGTLRMLSAFGASRRGIISAKFSAHVIMMIMALLFAAVFAILYLVVAGQLRWSGIDFAAFAMVLTVAVTYFCCIYTMGLFFSAVTQRSSSSIIIAFLVWTILAFIVPNVSPFIASWIYPTPSVEKTNAEVRMILDTERDEVGRRYAAEVQANYATTHPNAYQIIVTANRDELEQFARADSTVNRVHIALQNSIDSAWGQANSEQQEKAARLREHLTRAVMAQQRLARLFSSMSPTADLLYAMEGISVTGRTARDVFAQQAEQYYGQFGEYIERKFAAYREQQPNFSVDDYMDLNDRPELVYRTPGILDRLKQTWLNILLLIMYAVLCFLAANIAFTKYDIR